MVNLIVKTKVQLNKKGQVNLQEGSLKLNLEYLSEDNLTVGTITIGGGQQLTLTEIELAYLKEILNNLEINF